MAEKRKGNISKKRVDMEVAESIKASIKDAKEVTANVHLAVEKYPKIVDGYWHVWNAESGAFESTGIKAQSESADADDTMSDTSENAVQNKVVKQYVDGRIAAFKNSKFWYAIETSITEECEITARNNIWRTNLVKFSVKMSQYVGERVTVIVTLLNSIEANSCYLEIYDNSGLNLIQRETVSEVSGNMATFSFFAYGDCSLRAMWTETPETNSCTVEVKYDQDVRDLFDSKAGNDDVYSKTQIDETIQSAILDSWEVPV